MEALGVDYAWLQEQLAELSAQLNSVGLEDEFEDEYEEWEDPSGGLLTRVFEACENDDAAGLGPLLEELKGTQWGVNTHGPDGDTPLHTACLYGSEACVDVLLAAGARVDALNPEDGTSVLHDAAAGGYASIMRTLVDAARRQLGGAGTGGGGAAQQQQEEEGGKEEPGKQQPEASDKAQQAGGGGGDGAAALRAVAPPPKSLSDLLNVQDSEGETALHNAARGNHVEAVRLLLSLGADPSIAANDGSLPADEPEDEGVAAILQAAVDGEEEDEGEEDEGEEEEGEEEEEEEEEAAPPPKGAGAATPAAEGGDPKPTDGKAAA